MTKRHQFDIVNRFPHGADLMWVLDTVYDEGKRIKIDRTAIYGNGWKPVRKDTFPKGTFRWTRTNKAGEIAALGQVLMWRPGELVLRKRKKKSKKKGLRKKPR